MPKHLVLAGVGHAHLPTLSRLADFQAAGIAVTCIAPGPYLAYSGMGPGLLAGRYALDELRAAIERMMMAQGECLRRPGEALPLLDLSAGGDHPPRTPWIGGGGAGGAQQCMGEATREREGQSRENPRTPWTSGGMAGGAQQCMGEATWRKEDRTPGCRFLRGRVVGIAPERRRLFLADGRELAYDAVSFGIGSTVAETLVAEDSPETAVYTVKPIENLLLARQDILARVAAGNAPRVVVAGGGPAGFEVAGCALGLLAGLGVDAPSVAVAAPRGLLPDWPARGRRLAGTSLARRGGVVVPARLVRLEGGQAVFDDGSRRPCDVLLAATGTRPPAIFRECGLSAAPDGGLTVNACLQSPFFPEVFGGGDCIHFGPKPLPRAGVYAVRQGPVLRANLLAALTGRKLTPFCRTGTNFLALLNCGDGRAILRKGPLVAEGRWCMALKDAIDRRFMRMFAC